MIAQKLGFSDLIAVRVAQAHTVLTKLPTLSVMVGVAPNGTVNFVSDVYGGNASDKHIVETSGLLEQLAAGDLILACLFIAVRGGLVQIALK